MKTLKKVITVLVLLISFVGRTGIETYSSRIEGSDITTGDFDVYDAKYFDMYSNPFWSNDFTNYKVTNFVRLGLNPKEILQADNSGTVEVIITYHVWNTGTSTFDIVTVTRTLGVDYLIDGTQLIDDQSTYLFSDAHFINVEVGTITGIDVDDLYLESSIEVERYYTMYSSMISGLSDRPIPISATPTPNAYWEATNEFIEINWPYHIGAESYELEWVHINDYETATTYKSETVLPFDYYLNSTRIELKENSYRIPNIFDHGYLLYRIRPIGRKAPDFKDRIDGQWSSATSGMVSDQTVNKIFIAREYDAGMNWSHQVSYTEGGKRFESTSYADGLGRVHQSVAKNTVTDQVVVSNVYYDEIGRAVISDLPTPVDEGYLKHFPDFNRADISGTPSYNYNYFDLEENSTVCEYNSQGMSSTATYGASNYYSTDNPNKDGENANIPDAENFPFNRVTYRDDFTGRVDRIAAAGGTLKMGENHETRILYESPDQSELNRLFGAEVGWASHYQKTTTIDQNGQVYVQYTDMAGRVVATYMVGESPDNLIQIQDADNTYFEEHDILNNGFEQVPTINPPVAVFTHNKYFSESSAEYQFDYSFTPQEYQDLCMLSSVCFDCIYDLSISIVEECGDIITIPNPTIKLTGGELDGECNGVYTSALDPLEASVDGLPISFSVTIPKGYYTITKTLSVNQDAIDDYWCLYIDNLESTEDCLPLVSDIFNEAYEDASFSGCEEEIPTPIAAGTDCDIRRELMLNDVSPGGQYALYNVTGGVYSASDPTSIFYPTGGTAPFEGTYDNGLGGTVTFGSSDMEDFITGFRDEWAEDLLVYHPEHCYIESGGFCDQMAASYAYDEAMLNTYDFATACAAGYLVPLGIYPTTTISLIDPGCANSPIDPFFDTGALGAIYKTSMQSDLNSKIQIGGNSVNLWYYIMAKIGDPNATTYTEIEDGYDDFHDEYLGMDSECLGGANDLVWVRFRDAYLEWKKYYYIQAQEDYKTTDCPALSGIDIGVTSGDYEDKIPIFPSELYMLIHINQLSTTYGTGATVTSLSNQSEVEGVINSIAGNQCETACEQYAEDWLDQLSGCDIDPSDYADLKADFIAFCMEGCDNEHPGGASTLPSGTIITFPNSGGPFTDPTIQTILGEYGYTESTLCTELLISEPAPYDNALSTIDQIMVPIDVCVCDALYQAQLDSINGVYPGVNTLEEIVALNTGVELDDVHYLLCTCDAQMDLETGPWTPGFDWSVDPGEPLNDSQEVPVGLACPESQGCASCETIGSHGVDLITRFGYTSEPTPLENFEDFLVAQNAEEILGNYLNNELNFHHTYSTYLDFIYSCLASEDDPYCTVNPLAEELSEVLELLAFRGQLTSTSAINLEVENIVYANGELIEEGIGPFYSSSISGSTLTATFTDGLEGDCEVEITIPGGASFDFEDIFSFDGVRPTYDCPGPNNTFIADIKYISCGKIETGTVEVSTDCFEVNECICSASGLVLCDDPFSDNEDNDLCYQPFLDEMYQNTLEEFEYNVVNQYQHFKETYNAKCAEAFETENLSYAGPNRTYQYTLFYYDQAGNLVKTIAPEGVDFLLNSDNAQINTERTNAPGPGIGVTIPEPLKPGHEYITSYQYNSYNQLVLTTNPDQNGNTKFWYDFYGRIVASQNPVQKDEDLYSFTYYDDQGRPFLVGQTEQTTPLTDAETKVDDKGVAFVTWVSSGSMSEITYTVYDQPLAPLIETWFTNGKQENLRLRVASVFYIPNGGGFDYESAIHYSYDIHGNVIEQIQDVPALAPVEQDKLSTLYDFELISGNVRKVTYQNEKADHISHEYVYDELNRLTEVFTSTDELHKTREAHYRYYDYGPLSRVELGQQKVQGMDYAYTINGWLKGMNSSMLDVNHDIGNDGIAGYLANHDQVHKLFAKDVVSYTMGYFNGDYTSILGTQTMEATVNDDFDAYNLGLYNGNIRHTVTSIKDMPTLGAGYKYDQLQRLKEMTAFYKTNNNNNWTSEFASADYFNDYSYDKNGNLLHLNRNGISSISLDMDELDYFYSNILGEPTNRLNFVTDNVGGPSLSYGDIGDQTSGNFTYDKIGQLISDFEEDITMEWRFGDKKLKSLTRGSEVITFTYNPFGQRVMKTVTPTSGDPINTYYGYDANGQVMAVYTVVMEGATNTVTLSEQHIYGASRLGMIKQDLLIYDDGATLPPFSDDDVIKTNTIGLRNYEVTNHLGNVNAVITDRKTWNNTDGLYEAVVTMTADYYPGGFLMPGRGTGLGDYRYAYNGMETDTEVTGDYGNSYTTEFRQYDPRLMRWKSLDPLMHQFPWMSPYVAFDNNPIYYTDVYGLSSDGPGDGEDNGPPENAKVGDKYTSPSGNDYTFTDGGWINDEIQNVKEVEAKGYYYGINPDRHYSINSKGEVREAGIMETASISGKVIRLAIEQSIMDHNRKEFAGMNALAQKANAIRNDQATRDAQYNLAMMQNPITAAYKISPIAAGVEAGKELEAGNYATAGGILAMEFLPGPTEDIIRSARRVVTGKTPRGIQKLNAKVGRGDDAYSSIKKVTQVEVDNVIRSVMNSPDRIMMPPTRNQQGKPVVDFFNPKTGQGVRVDMKTGEFDTFINH